MPQQEQINALKENTWQAKQLNVMLEIVNNTFRNNMSSYFNLVQIDVIKEFNVRCETDGVGGDRVKFSHGVMDPIMKQVIADLENRLRSSLRS
jgi:hypothetical protein